MNITFNDLELLLLFATILVCVTIFCAVQFYEYVMFNKRCLNYQFFEARDALIRCVALNLISKDDLLFKTFYSASNTLVNVTNTDFFSLRLFLKEVTMIDNKEAKVFGKKLISEIKKQPQQFQDAVDKLFYAIEVTFIKKNFILRIYVDSVVTASIMKIVLNKILKLFNIDSSKSKPIIEQKKYIDEYKKIANLRQRINPLPVYT